MNTYTMPKKLGIIAAIIALAAGLTAAIGFAHTANAEERNLVVFGDSIFANPSIPEYMASHTVDRETTGGCGRQQDSIAVNLGASYGLVPYDYSCPGASIFSVGKKLTHEVSDALNAGALHPGTQEIVIQIGANDTYPNLVRGKDWSFIEDNYRAGMLTEIQRMRDAAPNARIRLVGYPSVSDDGVGTCLVRFPGNIHSMERSLGGPMIWWEKNLADMMWRTADAAGIQFIDTRSMTLGHGMCADDGQRYTGGWYDKGESIRLPVHLTDRGKNAVTDIIAAN